MSKVIKTVFLSLLPHRMVSTLLFLAETQKNVTIEVKAIRQCFLVVLLYKVVLTFESVDEILMCDHSNESY